MSRTTSVDIKQGIYFNYLLFTDLKEVQRFFLKRKEGILKHQKTQIYISFGSIEQFLTSLKIFRVNFMSHTDEFLLTKYRKRLYEW